MVRPLNQFEGIPVLECQNGKAEVVSCYGSGDKCSSEQKLSWKISQKENQKLQMKIMEMILRN